MTDQRPGPDALEEPELIRNDAGERTDGRPTDVAGDADTIGESAWDSPEAVPTEAPEEQGATPSTEHGPGSSL